MRKKMVRDRQRQTELSGRERREGWGELNHSSVWLYSPRRMGYRTLFYAAFVCAYACCLSAGKTHPVHAPSHDHGGSRTCLGRSRAGSKSQLLHADPFLCRGWDLGWDPGACILRSIFCQTAAAPWSDCHSSDWVRQQTQRVHWGKQTLHFAEEI